MISGGRRSEGLFINCPFDSGYKPLLESIVFAVLSAGFDPRCSLEFDDATEVRISKILRIIGECRYGVHDISYTHIDTSSGLPRFNVPFELGIFLGCKAFGAEPHSSKIGLVLDREPYRYQRSISDLSGMDIRYHNNEPRKAIREIRDWLRIASRREDLPGAASIGRAFRRFRGSLPRTCRHAACGPTN